MLFGLQHTAHISVVCYILGMRHQNEQSKATHRGVGGEGLDPAQFRGEGKDRNLFYSQNATLMFSKYLADQTKTRVLNVSSNKKGTFQYFKRVAVQGGECMNQRNMPHFPAAGVCLTTEKGTQHWLLWEATQ